jgi:ABC-type uncharacterized transport system permease subunit
METIHFFLTTAMGIGFMALLLYLCADKHPWGHPE